MAQLDFPAGQVPVKLPLLSAAHCVPVALDWLGKGSLCDTSVCDVSGGQWALQRPGLEMAGRNLLAGHRGPF